MIPCQDCPDSLCSWNACDSLSGLSRFIVFLECRGGSSRSKVIIEQAVTLVHYELCTGHLLEIKACFESSVPERWL